MVGFPVNIVVICYHLMTHLIPISASFPGCSSIPNSCTARRHVALDGDRVDLTAPTAPSAALRATREAETYRGRVAMAMGS